MYYICNFHWCFKFTVWSKLFNILSIVTGNGIYKNESLLENSKLKPTAIVPLLTVLKQTRVFYEKYVLKSNYVFIQNNWSNFRVGRSKAACVGTRTVRIPSSRVPGVFRILGTVWKRRESGVLHIPGVRQAQGESSS